MDIKYESGKKGALILSNSIESRMIYTWNRLDFVAMRKSQPCFPDLGY